MRRSSTIVHGGSGVTSGEREVPVKYEYTVGINKIRE